MDHSPLLETQKRLAPELVLAPVLDEIWEMPAHYGPHRLQAEYDAVRSQVGMIDRAWRGIVRLTGTDRQSFLQGMVTNDIVALSPGQSCRAAFLDTTGHLRADLRVHSTPDALLIETDPRVLPRLLQTLDTFLIMEDVQIADESTRWTCLSLRGPEFQKGFTVAAADGEVPNAPYANTSIPLREGGTALVTSPAPEDDPGLDLWLPRDRAAAVWAGLYEAGIVPVGEQAAETLRVEAGEAVWGRELQDSTLLLEADLPDTVSYFKGCYLGQEIVARLHARGHTNRVLRGILLPDGAPVPHPGDTLHAPEDGAEAGREIGWITSAVASPRFSGRALALGYLRREYAEANTPVAVHRLQPGGLVFTFAAQILTRPFV